VFREPHCLWELIEKADRPRDEDDLMLHAAHASAYHWRQVGEVKNFARSEWQCSRVYALLGRAEPALFHAGRCLEWCGRGEVDDFDLPFAYEALARARAVAGDREESARNVVLAREAGAAIADADDREHFERELSTV